MGINLSNSDVTSLDLVPRVVPFDGEVLGSLLATFTMDSDNAQGIVFVFMVEREFFLTLYVVAS
jgi:hypothetical protein